MSVRHCTTATGAVVALALALHFAAARPMAAAAVHLPDAAAWAQADTILLEVGSAAVDGRVYEPHRARVLVRLGAPDGPVVAEWINELSVGDSAGRAVHRWITSGTQMPLNGPTSTWEIRQTYDARTLAPLGYHLTSSLGADVRFTLDGVRVRGTRRPNASAASEAVAYELDRMGWVASASDLVPLAAGLTPGKVMVAPMWGPSMTQTERRVFHVIGQEPRVVEGKEWRVWRIEERRYDNRRLLATWFMVDESPYMVAGEVIQPNGQVRYMTEIALP